LQSNDLINDFICKGNNSVRENGNVLEL